MEPLDYAEGKTAATLAVLRKDYDDMHQRSHTLLALLVGAAGAAAAYCLDKMGAKAPLMTWVPIAALGLSWACTAGWLVWFGMRSKWLSAGSGPSILSYYDERVAEGTWPDPLEITRRMELGREAERMKVYRDAITERSESLDCAYLIAASAPLVMPVVGWLACKWFW